MPGRFTLLRDLLPGGARTDADPAAAGTATNIECNRLRSL